MKFQLESHHRNIANQELIDDLIRVAKELGKDKVTIDQYNEKGRFIIQLLVVGLAHGSRRSKKLGYKRQEL